MRGCECLLEKQRAIKKLCRRLGLSLSLVCHALFLLRCSSLDGRVRVKVWVRVPGGSRVWVRIRLGRGKLQWIVVSIGTGEVFWDQVGWVGRDGICLQDLDANWRIPGELHCTCPNRCHLSMDNEGICSVIHRRAEAKEHDLLFAIRAERVGTRPMASPF